MHVVVTSGDGQRVTAAGGYSYRLRSRGCAIVAGLGHGDADGQGGRRRRAGGYGEAGVAAFGDVAAIGNADRGAWRREQSLPGEPQRTGLHVGCEIGEFRIEQLACCLRQESGALVLVELVPTLLRQGLQFVVGHGETQAHRRASTLTGRRREINLIHPIEIGVSGMTIPLPIHHDESGKLGIVNEVTLIRSVDEYSQITADVSGISVQVIDYSIRHLVVEVKEQCWGAWIVVLDGDPGFAQPINAVAAVRDNLDGDIARGRPNPVVGGRERYGSGRAVGREGSCRGCGALKPAAGIVDRDVYRERLLQDAARAGKVENDR